MKFISDILIESFIFTHFGPRAEHIYRYVFYYGTTRFKQVFDKFPQVNVFLIAG